MNRQNRSHFRRNRVAGFLFGFLPVVLAAQAAEVPVPNIEVNTLSQSFGLAIPNPKTQVVDPRFMELGDQIILTFKQFESNRSSMAGSSTIPRRTGAGKASAPTAKSKNTTSNFFTLKSNGVGKPITVLHKEKFEAKFDKSGTVRALTALPGKVLQESVGGPGVESHTETIQAFFRAQKPLLGLVDPEAELSLRSSQADELGHAHYRYQQSYKGIPVWGAELIAQLNKQGDILTLNGA
jgi:hypothetical protein